MSLQKYSCNEKKQCCVVLAGCKSCHPDQDIEHPFPGQLWIKTTDIMYVYVCEESAKWVKVPFGKCIAPAFSPATTTGTDEVLVSTFVFPAFDKGDENGCNLGIYKIQYSHGWTQEVSGTTSQGMLVIIRDKAKPEQMVACLQSAPSTYESFEYVGVEDIIYQPNPGDVLELVIQLPPVEVPDGQGILYSLKMELFPFYN